MPVLDRYGVTLDQFRAMQELAGQVGRDDLVNHFSTNQLQMMYEARMSHPHPGPDDVIQKIVSEPAVRSILEQVNNPGTPYGGGGPYKADMVGGCVSVASDAAHLRTPQDLLQAMRLDYGSPSPYETFTTTDHAYVIEGLVAAGDYFVPNGRVAAALGITDARVQDLPSGSPPHTGTGYTGDRNGVNPEYQLVDGKWAPGATLMRVDPDGSRHPVAVLDDSGTAWLPAKDAADHVVDGWPQHKGGDWIFPNSPNHGSSPDPVSPADPRNRGTDPESRIGRAEPEFYVGRDPTAGRVFEASAIDTEPGAAFFDPSDADMRAAVDDVPVFAGEFTVDVHGDQHAVSVWDSNEIEHRMSARDFADVLRNHTQWDGRSPIRLMSCDTGVGRSSFAADLAHELGVPVTAPDRPVWTFPDGRQPVVSDLERGPNGEERPRIPLDGGWHRFDPDGSVHRAPEQVTPQRLDGNEHASPRSRDGDQADNVTDPDRPLRDTVLPADLPSDPTQRAQAVDEAVRRAQEAHPARAAEVDRLRSQLQDLQEQRRNADTATKAELQQQIKSVTANLRDAENRAAESRELMRAATQIEHLNAVREHERGTSATGAQDLRAARDDVDRARPIADSRQAEVRRLARELASIEGGIRAARNADDDGQAQDLAGRRRQVQSDLRRARSSLARADRTLLVAGNRERQAAWRHSSPESREARVAQEVADVQRRMALRYQEFVAGDNAHADLVAARSASREVDSALSVLREVQARSELARRTDLDTEIRSQIDEATRQHFESRIRTDGSEDPGVVRDSMTSEDRARHWPVVDLQHIRQDIVNRRGPGAEWQFERQMRGLTRCSAEEIVEALSMFHDNLIRPSRGGNEPARRAFEASLRGQLLPEAERLVAAGRYSEAQQFLNEQVASVVAQLAALHEQDCAGGGADHITSYMGLPVLADQPINSSLGTIWTQTVRDPSGNPAVFFEAILAVAQAQINVGRGSEPLDIWYANFG